LSVFRKENINIDWVEDEGMMSARLEVTENVEIGRVR